MTTRNDPSMARVEELLADRALDGLDEEQARELEFAGAAADDSFDLAAAAATVATLDIQPMPAIIAGRILAAVGVPAKVAVQEPTSRDTALVIPIDQLPRRSRAQTFAYLAAAAGLALAIGAWIWASQRAPQVQIVKELVPAPAVTPIELPPAEQRARLVASAPDLETLAWTATDDPNGKGATGDVVWSAAAQQGYMRFVGLAPNDRAQLQYQLWIFDATRDQAFPVDGGVFDIASTGEVIVPISAKLRVTKTAMFAVTIEQPGGVVVSKRERIVVLAKRA